MSGINTDICKAHSTQGASALYCAAPEKGVFISEILRLGHRKKPFKILQSTPI